MNIVMTIIIFAIMVVIIIILILILFLFFIILILLFRWFIGGIQKISLLILFFFNSNSMYYTYIMIDCPAFLLTIYNSDEYLRIKIINFMILRYQLIRILHFFLYDIELFLF